MHEILKDYIAKFKNDHREKRKAISVFLMMAVIVAVGVGWSLKLDGIAVSEEAFCGKEEHTHNEKCTEKELVCGKEETDPNQKAETETPQTEAVLTCMREEHVHNESCTETVLVCGQEESAGHTHSEANGCYQSQTVLVCSQGEHTHGSDCYVTETIQTCTLPEHVHGDGCYDEEGNLICGMQEHIHGSECYTTQETFVCGQAEHIHGDGCYQTEQILVCQLPESEGHTHSESCYETRNICEKEEHIHGDECYTIVTLPSETQVATEAHVHTDECYEVKQVCEKEEHIHTTECYSDKNADLESAGVWESTLPGSLTGVWADDLISVARSQLGYQESTRNFILSEDGNSRKGYTRYGAWYGNPYGDWCAMFVSFCLNYANIPQSTVPYASGCYAWTVELQNRGMFGSPSSYIPVPGDLVFFRWNGSGVDHVGIVTYVNEEQGYFNTIEGNASNAVCERQYSLGDGTIVGYGVLPENPALIEEEPETETETETDTQKITEKATEKVTESETERVTEKVTESDTEKITEKVTESETEKITEKMTETETEEDSEKVSETTVEKAEETVLKLETSAVLESEASIIIEDEILVCDLEEHTHSEECMGEEDSYICGREEHVHTEECYETMEFSCGIHQHVHTEECYDEAGELICGKDEHIHRLECLLLQVEMMTLSDDGASSDEDTAVSNETIVAMPLNVTSITGSGTTYDSISDSYTSELKIDFTVTKTEDTTNTLYVYKYPEGVVIPEDLLGTKFLYDYNTYAGTYTFVKNEDGTYSVQIKFDSEYVASAGDTISGFVQFGGRLQVNETEENGSIKLVGFDNVDLYIPSSGISYPENETNNYDINVSKSGSYVTTDGDKLIYTVYIRSLKGTPEWISFTDTIIADGLTLGEPTVTVEQGTYNWYTKDYKQDNNDWTVVSVSQNYNNGIISMSLNGLSKGEAITDSNNSACIKANVYRITYTYDITNQSISNVSPKNTVKVISMDETKGQTVTNEATATVDVFKDLTRTLDKVGSYDPDNSRIKWTITVNTNGKDLAGFTLNDAMLGEISSETNITVEPNEGYSLIKDVSDKYVGIRFDAGSNGINTNQYNITYYTDAPEDTSTAQLISNTVNIKTPDNEINNEKTATITVGGYTLDKAGWYNSSTGKVEWTIKINQNQSDITGTELYDNMFSNLAEGEFTITPSDGYEWIIDKVNSTITGIKFKGINNSDKNLNTYIISYSTTVQSTGETQSIVNKAIFDSKPEEEGGEIEKETTVTVGGYTAEKSGQCDYWNYNGRITWTITINNNQLDIADAILRDEMFSGLSQNDFSIEPNTGFAWIESMDSTEDKTISGIKFIAGENGKNTNKYVITYTTDNPSVWEDQIVTNEVMFTPKGKNPIQKVATVTIPGKGNVTKTMDGATVSEDGKTAEVMWTVKIDVPDGGLPVGTTIVDDVTKNQYGNANVNPQYMTRKQVTDWGCNLFWINADGTVTGSANPYTVPGNKVVFLASDGKEYTYTQINENQNNFAANLTFTVFTITLDEDLKPASGSTQLYFTYKTTVDVTKANIGMNTYYNSVTVGKKSSGDNYIYYKPGVVKTDGNGSTNTTSTTNADGILTWKVVATVGNQNSKILTLVDNLPNDVTLETLQLSGWSNLNMALELNQDDGKISGTDNTNQYKVNGTYSNNVITLNIEPLADGGTIQNNSQFTLTVTGKVNNAEQKTEKLTLINSASMKLDEVEIGSAQQTQEWTYKEDTEEKQVVDKSGAWDNDNRRLNYSIVLNPEGKNLVEGTDTLTLIDTMNYNRYQNSYDSAGQWYSTKIEAILVQNSVKLYQAIKNEDGTWKKGVSIDEWSWTWTSSDNGYNAITSILTGTGIPDETPLLLEYSYVLHSDAPDGYKFFIDIRNTAKLEGTSYSDSDNRNQDQWKEQSASAGVTTQKAFTLYKVEAGNYNNNLSGAKFSVYSFNIEEGNYDENVVTTYTTDEKGMFQIKWDDGYYAYNTLYKIIESQAPNGYKLPASVKEYYFYFSDDTNSTNILPEKLPDNAVDLSKISHTVYAENVKNTTEVIVEKKWKDKDGNSIAHESGSVAINLYQKTNQGSSSGGGETGGTGVTYKYTSNGSTEVGSGTFNNIQIGSVVEITVKMTYDCTNWQPIVTLTGLNGVNSGNWKHSANSIYTCQATITDSSIIVDVGDSVGNFTVNVEKISDSESTDSELGESGSSSDVSPTTGSILYETVILKNDNGWTYTFTNLPLTGTDEDGNAVTYYYYVEEVPVPNYDTSYENNGGIQSGTITVINKATDTPDNPSYELPETGGRGTLPYTMAGLGLMISAAYLWYKKKTCGKGEA